MDFQAYYSPESLSKKAWAKFKNKKVARMLEPNAGEGHLLKPWLDEQHQYHHGNAKAALVDCIEIDITRHPILRAMGLNVIGVDFMEFNGATSQYDKAEKFSSQLQAEIVKQNKTRSFWNHLEYNITSNDENVRDRAVAALDEAVDAVLLKNGIDPATLIGSDQKKQAQLPLLAAA